MGKVTMSPAEAVSSARRWIERDADLDKHERATLRVLVAEAEALWGLRSDLTAAFAAHAAEEGQDCCGADFANAPHATGICATWRRVFEARDRGSS